MGGTPQFANTAEGQQFKRFIEGMPETRAQLGTSGTTGMGEPPAFTGELDPRIKAFINAIREASWAKGAQETTGTQGQTGGYITAENYLSNRPSKIDTEDTRRAALGYLSKIAGQDLTSLRPNVPEQYYTSRASKNLNDEEMRRAALEFYNRIRAGGLQSPLLGR